MTPPGPPLSWEVTRRPTLTARSSPLELLPHYADRVRFAPVLAPPPRPRLPRSPVLFAERVTVVETAAAGGLLADLAREIDLTHVGWDFEFAAPVLPGLPAGGDVTDCRAIRPLLLSLALVGRGAGRAEPVLYPFVVDVRRPEVLPALAAVFELPVPFAGHFLVGDFHCLWRLGLPGPRVIWDTWAASRALALGRHHRKYRLATDRPPAAAREEADALEDASHALPAVCARFGVPFAFSADKGRLQASFRDHPGEAPFTAEQIDYSAADAAATAELYPHQLLAASGAGLVDHLVSIEMPWAAVNARFAWHGVRLDPAACHEVRAACDRHVADLTARLRKLGLGSFDSHPQLKAFFEQQGLLDLFRDGASYSFDQEALEAFADRHPAIPLIRAARKARQLRSDPVLWPNLAGADGRVHPAHRQLGTDTGRQTCRRPNVLGLGKVLRPLVVPDPGHGIGEADLCQIEVGVAAGVYGDPDLARMFNTGDVYSAMATRFYATELTPADLALPGEVFKSRFKPLRNKMKRCTLGIIYGLTPHGLAAYLEIPRADAEAMLDRFLGLFPVLRQALADAAYFGSVRGFAATATGLRRYRAAGRRGKPSAWERNWLTNHPVQGTAAALFKAAGVRLDRLYRAHDARLIVPLHDAFVFEAPIERLEAVGELTREALCQVVQEAFPELRPRAEVNIAKPGCWNKDGMAESVSRWLADPTFRLD
ncbi:MAG: polymerase [Gemmataceae bacterium]|nr:polymerase [Gemmataceae bacterium]